MNRALGFLIWTTMRNRFGVQVRRVKEPRYALALVVGGLYLWWFLFRPGRGGAGAMNSLLGATSAQLSPLFLLVILAGVWLFGGDRTALAFTPAEVSMLLTAPVSRRTLIGYKLVRSQLAILTTSLLWVFLLRRGSVSLPAIASVIGFWVLFMTLSCHRLGAALVHASSREHGRAGVRRHWVAMVVFVAIGAMLLVQLAGARTALAAATRPAEIFRVLAAAISTGAAHWILLPVRLAMAPTFAGSVGEWARAMPAAIGILLLHVVWVFRSDAAFEEAAAEASAARAAQLARFRARRGGAAAVVKPTAAKRTIALGSAGRPAVAIFWKNVICLVRTAQLRTLLGPVLFAFIGTIAVAGREGDLARNIALVASLMAVVLLLFGGRSIRNDFRSDMLHLPLLKSLPLSGTDMVAAQIASGALPMAAAQLVLFAIAEVALLFSRDPVVISADLRAGLVVAAPLGIVAINLAMFTILNGTAVLFPGWLRLGPVGPAGVEALGANVIATVGTLVVLALLLIVPGALGAIIFAELRGHLMLAIALAGTVGSLALTAESYGLMRGLGRAYENTEPLLVT